MWSRFGARAVGAARSGSRSYGTGSSQRESFGRKLRQLATGVIAGAACVGAVVYAEKPKHAPHSKLAEDSVAGLASGGIDREEAPIAAAEQEAPRQHGKPAPPRHAKYVIIGTGTAAYAAVQGIRAHDKTGEVLVIGQERCTPYQRPPLSKELWTGPPEDSARLRFLDWQGKNASVFYDLEESRGVEFRLGTAVQTLDTDNRRLVLEDGSVVLYGQVLIATGGTPKRLSDVVDPAAAGEVSTYRTVEDFRRLYERAASAKRVLVVGGGFLGSELAAALNHRGKAHGLKVTQVFPEPGVMHRVLPAYLSAYATRKLAAAGVEVRPGTTPRSIDAGAEGKGVRATLEAADGAAFCEAADHAVLAVGIEPSVRLAEEAGLPIDVARGGVAVDRWLQARPGVFAAGDVMSYPDPILGRRRVEHYDQAYASGKHAGANMALGLRGARPYTHQAAFWSSLEGTGVSFEAVGRVDSSLPTAAFFRVAPSPELGAPAVETQEYRRGVVVYLQGKRPVGVLLWNGAGGGVDAARALLAEARDVDRLEDLAKRLPL
eukprot:tig00021616_g22917.t1